MNADEMNGQLWLLEAEGEYEAASPRCSPLCVAIILETVAALDRQTWRNRGRVGFIRETIRGGWGQFSNRCGLTGEIKRVIEGSFPMVPEFRAEVEKHRPHVRERLPFK